MKIEKNLLRNVKVPYLDEIIFEIMPIVTILLLIDDDDSDNTSNDNNDADNYDCDSNNDDNELRSESGVEYN